MTTRETLNYLEMYLLVFLFFYLLLITVTTTLDDKHIETVFLR